MSEIAQAIAATTAAIIAISTEARKWYETMKGSKNAKSKTPIQDATTILNRGLPPPPHTSTPQKGKTMKPLELAATYTIGAFLLYAFTGYKWTLALGGALALSAIARHIYQPENAA